MIQLQLDAQEHIWKHLGHLEQYRTGHYLQMWHNHHRHIIPMALQVLPDTHPRVHLPTKYQWHSGILYQWAPTPKKPKFPQ